MYYNFYVHICLDDDGSNINNSVISTTVNATPNISTQNETCTTNKEKVAESDVVSQLGIKLIVELRLSNRLYC